MTPLPIAINTRPSAPLSLHINSPPLNVSLSPHSRWLGVLMLSIWEGDVMWCACPSRHTCMYNTHRKGGKGCLYIAPGEHWINGPNGQGRPSSPHWDSFTLRTAPIHWWLVLDPINCIHSRVPFFTNKGIWRSIVCDSDYCMFRVITIRLK